MRLFLDQQPLSLQILDDARPCLEAIQAAVAGRGIFIDCRGGGENVDRLEAVASADLPVVEIVSRSDLDAAGAELGVDITVSDHRNLAPGQWQRHGFADQIPVSLILRVHGHAHIAQQGFRPGGGNHHGTLAVAARIADRPDHALFVAVDHFQIGNGGLEDRIPVDQPWAAIDQTLLVQTHKGFGDRLGQVRIHGEAFARPVGRSTQAAHLAGDGRAGFLFPLPDAVNEVRARVVIAVAAFCLDLAVHHHLGGDAGMVDSNLPQGVASAHAHQSNQRIHQGVLKGMPHVQCAGHIGRRQQDAIGLALARRLETAAVLPMGIPALFQFMRVVGLVHHGYFKTW